MHNLPIEVLFVVCDMRTSIRGIHTIDKVIDSLINSKLRWKNGKMTNERYWQTLYSFKYPIVVCNKMARTVKHV